MNSKKKTGRNYQKKYRQENKDRYNEYQKTYQRKYRLEKPEIIKAIRMKYKKKVVQPTLTPYIDYNPMREALSWNEWIIVLNALSAYADKEPDAEKVQRSILSGLYPCPGDD